MLPMKLTLSKVTNQGLGLLPKKLMLEVSGLDAGKFRIVQLPSILICVGETGLTKPSITPPRSATQSSARAGTALSNDSAKANSRIPIQPYLTLTLFVPLAVMYALVPVTRQFVGG